MAKNGVDTPQKAEDLAKPLGIDPALLGWYPPFPKDISPKP